MATRLPDSPTPKNFADAVVSAIDPIATAIAGADERITKSEVRNAVTRNRVTQEESDLAAETILRQLRRSGASRPTVSGTMAGVGRRALRAARRAAGGDNRLSRANAMTGLPSDLARLFAHLRSSAIQPADRTPADPNLVARARTAYGESIEVGLAVPTLAELPSAARAKYEEWVARFPEPDWTIGLWKLPFEGDTLFAVHGDGNGGDFVPSFHELYTSDGTRVGHAFGSYGAAETWEPDPRDPSR